MIKIAQGVIPPEVGNFINGLPTGRFNSLEGPEGILVGIINWFLGFASVLAVAAIVYSGVMYITAGGDTSNADAAKKNLVWAITGIVVILLSYLIINWLNTILGGAA